MMWISRFTKIRKKLVLTLVSAGGLLYSLIILTGNGNNSSAKDKVNCSNYEHDTYHFDAHKYFENDVRFLSVKGVDCSRLFAGDKIYTNSVMRMVLMFNDSLSDKYFVNLTENCEKFHRTRGYIMSSLTEEEEHFPIAFSIMTYTNTEMVERLLRAIYRPQNYYCIHVDLKASRGFVRAISAIVQCFHNVFIATEKISVEWGTFSVLEPEILCMKELWRYKKWKYFINLTGQEFPLKTNFELVKILKAYNGATNINGTDKRTYQQRWKNNLPPFGLQPVKGSVHITASRHFVDFILHNQTAQAVLNWSRAVLIPDEAFFPTLYFNPQLGVRGTYKGGDPVKMTDFITRFKIWAANKTECAGRRLRGLCILCTADLFKLGQAKHLFANKFLLEEDRVVIGCLEEKLFNDTRDNYIGVKNIDDTYYSNLEFVKNQIL